MGPGRRCSITQRRSDNQQKMSHHLQIKESNPSWAYQWRHALVALGCVQDLFTSGVAYGWPSLVLILEDEVEFYLAHIHSSISGSVQ